MKILEKIKSPIKKEMDLFEEKFSSSMISDVPLLNRITHYVVKRKGKQMRPMFVFLTAKMMSNNGCVNEKVFRAASIIELIHTATLIHDDVVDSSNKRRGFFSLKKNRRYTTRRFKTVKNYIQLDRSTQIHL